MVVVHIGLAAGCYEPALTDCMIRCEGPAQCVADQVCLDGFCAAPVVARCTDQGQPVIVDAAAATSDAMPPPDGDPNALCIQGCSKGTCIDGVCTIDCSEPGTCLTDVVCPMNLPCHVICGDGSCNGKVNCAGAASCAIDCIGDYACDDDISCPSGRPCDVTCSGANSCKHRTKCSNSCSCNVACTGLGSCAEASECPSMTCRIGNGCTSQLAGCNTCE